MKKRRIVLASLLKPVNDTRMYEKMGVSLAKSGKYEVHIIGYPNAAEMTDPKIKFYSLPKFKRLGIGRVGARLKALSFAIEAKPEILIVNTHELLVVAILIRILFGAKIIYDVQENYWQNIMFTNAFHPLIRPTVAFLVRLQERLTAPLFARFLLAEKCYVRELSFVGKKFIVVENKCLVPPGFQRNPSTDFIELIFTGTIAESTGILHAINLTKMLHVVEPKIRLTIIGFSSQSQALEKIVHEISQNSFITLIGGADLVPHAKVMEAIAKANFGIIYYPRSPHTENKIPTKLYEYLACQLPILLQNHKPWVAICDPLEAAINVDFERPDINTILEKIRASSFYSKTPEGVTWESEEKKLLELQAEIF